MKTNEFQISRAKRSVAYIRLALEAPSGGGKTHSALLIAKGLLEGAHEEVDGHARICLIDTENGSANLEAGKPGIPEFDTLPLVKPYSPERYRAALSAAVDGGYEVIIIDSSSHAWSGVGGVLEMHGLAADADPRSNSFSAWRHVTPQHNKLVEAMLEVPAHLIVTMRTKTEWSLEKDERGKTVPVKIGLKPIQREGLEYEFTVVFDLSAAHVATVSKDRTSLFDGSPHIPSAETGEKLRMWLLDGSPVEGRLDSMLSELKAKKSEVELREWWERTRSERGQLPKSSQDALREAVAKQSEDISEKSAPSRGELLPKKKEVSK